MNSGDGNHKGRPHGGIAILWKKSLGHLCTVKLTQDETRIMSIDVKVDNKTISIINVYLPYDDGNSQDEYTHYLCKISSMM